MVVDRPIFIAGPHRSGTTLLYDTLTQHPDLGYFVPANRHTPNWPRLALLRLKLGSRDEAVEGQDVWDYFKVRDSDVMGAEDATPAVTRWYQEQMEVILAGRGATRFIAKYPRLSMRMPWVDAMFPDARYIYLRRDWRSVVHSTVVRIRKRHRRGGGWFGTFIPGWQDLQSLQPEIIAGRIYRVSVQALENDIAEFGDRVVTTSYEELCSDTEATLHKLLDHCGLRPHPEFEEKIPQDLRASERWKKEFDPAFIEQIRSEDPGFFAAHEL